MNRRHLLAAPFVMAAAPAAAAGREELPGDGAIRIWSNMAVHAFIGRERGLGQSEAQALASLTETFERVVGPLPYRFRSSINGRVIVVTHLRGFGMPAIRYEDGSYIGRQD